tara:strand:+ start:3439 stop:4299 length:861 start_codon:yes stop_codon:yes gene_type:complete
VVKFASVTDGSRTGIAVEIRSGIVGAAFAGEPGYPGDLDTLVASGPSALAAAGQALAGAAEFDVKDLTFLPPLRRAGKLLCIGLNYADHSAEGGFAVPDYPTVFARFNTSLVGHGQPLIKPRASDQFDYEGEVVAVIGTPGRHIPKESALDHVIGYSLFNDASVRDFQMRTPQWTVGKNFDGTGAFGPWLVTADALPNGCAGLTLETRLNGETVQSASTDDLVFDVATLVSTLSEAMTLEAGDVIVSGTPAGVGIARKPQLFMKPGDICDVEVAGLGTLSNSIAEE